MSSFSHSAKSAPKTHLVFTSLEYGPEFWESHKFAEAFTTRGASEVFHAVAKNHDIVITVPAGYGDRARTEIDLWRKHFLAQASTSKVRVYETQGGPGPLSAQILNDHALLSELAACVQQVKKNGGQTVAKFFDVSANSAAICARLGVQADASDHVLTHL